MGRKDRKVTNMGQIAFRADQYFNNKKKIDTIYGDMACPVDINAGYVAQKTDKWGMDKKCGEYTEDNIQERFGLETPNEGGESY